MVVYILIGVNSCGALILCRWGMSIFQLWRQFDFLKGSGVSMDWWRLLPLSDNNRLWMQQYLDWNKALRKTHLSREDRWVFHFLWTFFIPGVCLIGIIRNYQQWYIYFVVLMVSQVIKKLLIVSYKKRRTHVFIKNAYRLYKFLHNQISAGVQPKQCMTSLHRIVQEPFLKERLKALGSLYAQTLDFELAFEEVSRYYEGADIDAFRIAMLQGITMGDNMNTLKKQEELMFSKYMNYLQLETNRQKLRTLVVVTIFCAIIIFMIGLPLMMELEQAIEMIFIQ